jgi:hypothetical protein
MLIQFPPMKEVKIAISWNEHDTELLAGWFNLRFQRLGTIPAVPNQGMHYHARAMAEIRYEWRYHLILSGESHQDPLVLADCQICCSLLVDFDPSPLDWD